MDSRNRLIYNANISLKTLSISYLSEFPEESVLDFSSLSNIIFPRCAKSPDFELIIYSFNLKFSKYNLSQYKKKITATRNLLIIS